MKIPIEAAKTIADNYQQSQVIVFAWDGNETHVVTYGTTLEYCDQAARGANVIKKKWGWPEDMLTEPSRVQALRATVKRLEEKVVELEAERDRLSDHLSDFV